MGLIISVIVTPMIILVDRELTVYLVYQISSYISHQYFETQTLQYNSNSTSRLKKFPSKLTKMAWNCYLNHNKATTFKFSVRLKTVKGD